MQSTCIAHAKYMHATCEVLSQQGVQEKEVEFEQNAMIHTHEDAIMKFIICTLPLKYKTKIIKYSQNSTSQGKQSH